MRDKENKAKHHFIGINILSGKSDVMIDLKVI